MRKVYLIITALVFLGCLLSGDVLAEWGTFKYPEYVIDACDPDANGWWGVDANGSHPVYIDDLEEWLVGPPPSDMSAVTLPIGHWVELKFCGQIIDGPGDDIVLIEYGRAGEQASVFLTDGLGHEYYIGTKSESFPGEELKTSVITFEMPNVSLPFVPCAVRILGVDEGGAAPGFDLNSVRVRTCMNYCQLSDLNGDQIVNFKDFVILAHYWADSACLEPDWCQGIDFDQSGSVDSNDLSVFTDNWLRICYECSDADLNSDGGVDFIDYTILAGNWKEKGLNLDGDINSDCVVDMSDLRLLVFYWANSCSHTFP